MKKIYFYAILCMFLFFVTGVRAQETTINNIKIEQIRVDKQGDDVKVEFSINLDNLKIGTADMIILTPILRSEDMLKFKKFAPVVVTGARRSKTLKRAINMEGYRFESEPQLIVRRYNRREQFIPVTLTTTYENWLHNANLVINESVACCGLELKTENEYIAYNPVLPSLVEPQYALSYITPPAEEVKQRSETYTARLNFEVGKYKLLRDYKNNAEILNDVDKVINEIRNNKDLSISEFRVVGYASPEGNALSNMKLSENRAKAFVSYLTERYSIAASTIKPDWIGDDWAGLYKLVEASSIIHKSEILKALEMSNADQRKRRISQIGGGEAYKVLLRDYYPQLRRNEYTISFVAKPFSVEEAKEMIKTKPQYLSLNEMFLVANTYPKSSREFKEVFDIAARLYPDSPIAQQNTAALELENGAVDSAIKRLSQIDLPESWNNLGIAYIQKEDYQKAKDCFSKAAKAGNKAAADNLEQLNKWLEAQ